MPLRALYPPLAGLLPQVEAEMERIATSRLPFIARAATLAVGGRGKRLRPTLLLLAAEAQPGGASERAVAYGAIVELLHNCSLIHDDVIDESDVRRGEKTARALFGNKFTVLLGDYLLARSFTRLAEDGSQQLSLILTQVAAEMAAGNLLEVFGAGQLISEEQYLQMIWGKTASLYGAAARLGTFIGGGDESTAEALCQFGEQFGLAFQIADDILDLTADEADTGKPAASDLRERKLTLPVIHALEEATDDERTLVRGLLTTEPLTDEALDAVRDLIARRHSIDYAWGRVQGLLDTARAQLDPLSLSPARDALHHAVTDAFPLPILPQTAV